MNFSAKAQLFFPKGFNLTLSTQKIKPANTTIMMYDAGVYYHAHGWHVEAEYLYKHYSHEDYHDVNAIDAFVNYDIPLRGNKNLIKTISPLVRYDYMSDHSDGKPNEDGLLTTDEYKRSRITGGITLSLAKPFISDIRINYEKYLYRDGAIVKPSEHDKFVIEFMTRF